MEDQAGSTESQHSSETTPTLPKGCVEFKNTKPRFIDRLLHGKNKYNESEWQHKWGELESAARGIVEETVKYALTNANPRLLDSMSPDGETSNRVMVSRAIASYKEGKFSVITSNRAGLNMGKDKLADGGTRTLHLMAGNVRAMHGNMIGMVLNVESTALNFRNGSSKITTDQMDDVAQALINCQIEYEKAEKENRLDQFMTPEEVSRALDFVLFDKR